MILVDKQIAAKVRNDELIVEGFKEENLHCISYDLTVETIICRDKKGRQIEKAAYSLMPGEFIYIETKEKLKIPKNIVGIVEERNSVMRMGLSVTGPCYQPGHVTKAFLRVLNISGSTIEITRGFSVAQILFEYLPVSPAVPYSMECQPAFQNENQFIGLGTYSRDYNKYIEEIEKKEEDLNKIEHRIYANSLTLMTILVSILGLLIFNFSALNESIDLLQIVRMNFSLGLTIDFLVGLVFFFIDEKRNAKTVVAFSVITVLLILANIVVWR